MSDLIKREDAIEALTAEFYITGKENARTILNYLDLVKTRIKAIPSADRPQGEWILIYNDPLRADFKCSKCFKLNNRATRYCPNCGANMEGENDVI